ncbi:MAG: 3'-5' exonuclease [Bacteroidetes bacterium]|nr:3'-5' exonuclease [Bacteroidota bacterium]
MKLQLQRPIAFVDLETTGINISSDRIVEIAIIKILPDGSSTLKRKLINPQMPIPAESSQIHGITDEMVSNEPTFKQIANEFKQFLDNCDLGGYNSNRFDIPLLVEEFLRAGLEFSLDGRKLIDVQKIFHQMEQRTLSAAYKFYCSKNLDDAHSAQADVQATWEVLQAQLEKYENLGETLDSVLKVCGEDDMVDLARRFIKVNGIEVFNFGKHKGKPVALVLKQEPQYYDWMMKGDFALNTKQKLTEMLNRTLLKKA